MPIPSRIPSGWRLFDTRATENSVCLNISRLLLRLKVSSISLSLNVVSASVKGRRRLLKNSSAPSQRFSKLSCRHSRILSSICACISLSEGTVSSATISNMTMKPARITNLPRQLWVNSDVMDCLLYVLVLFGSILFNIFSYYLLCIKFMNSWRVLA